MKRFMTAGLSAAFGLAIQIAPAAAQEPTFESVLEGARKEGALTIRITNPSSPEAHKALIEEFNKRFKLSLKIEWTPAGAPQTNVRVITEASGGQGTVDIIGLGSAEDADTLRTRGLLKQYPWEKVFGKELPQIGAAVNGVMPDLRGYAFDLLDAVYGVGWNSQMVRDEDAPSTTAELLDPKWKGKLALNAFFLNPLPTIAYLIGQDEMLAYARKLIDNRPIMQRGSPVVMQALSVGQAPVGIITYHGAQRAIQQGQPVKFKLFSDFIMIYEGLIYIPENAPHPNAARLFTAWLATEGVAVAARFEAMPRVADPNSDVSKLIREAQTKTGARIAAPPSLAAVADQQKLREALTKLLTGAN